MSNTSNPTSLAGIVNMGNTCYVNAAIQVLIHNKWLRNFLLENEKANLEHILINAPSILDLENEMIPPILIEQIKSNTYDPNNLINEHRTIIYAMTMTCQMTLLAKHMFMQNNRVYPASFMKIFKESRNKFFYGYGQHDSEEAFSCIIQKMQEELRKKNMKFRFKDEDEGALKYIKAKQLLSLKLKNCRNDIDKQALALQNQELDINNARERIIASAYNEIKKFYDANYNGIFNIFGGFMHSYIKCPNKSCKYTSNKFDYFTTMSLSVADTKVASLDNCLDDYCKPEILDNDNMWLCNRCKNKVNAIKRIKIWNSPNCLVIQLKKFDYNGKHNTHVTFPLELDISKYLSRYNASKTNSKYKLGSIVNHMGSMESGHYYSYVYNETVGNWVDYDDQDVKIIDNKIALKLNPHAYLLFYYRI